MRVFIGILMILITELVNSQNIELIDFSNEIEFTVDCDYVNDCIDTISIDSNLLTIKFYSNVTCEYEFPPTLTYHLNYDSLIIENYSKPMIIKDTIVYDSINNKYDSFKVVNYYGIYSIRKKYWCRKFTIKFKGINYVPQFISYNNNKLTNCTDGYYEYEICQGDTINVINKNGFKDGKWIDFFDTGEIQKRKIYKNGKFLEGYIYDKNGKITHNVYEGYNEISVPINDELNK